MTTTGSALDAPVDAESVDAESVDTFRTADGVTLRVAESGHGDGPVLVLVHGWTQDLRTWDRVVDDLRAAGHHGRVLRYDHRGHGGSDSAPRGTATVGRIADDLAEILAARVPAGADGSAPPVVLAGHSMGGMALVALAERHPELVAARVAGVAFVATAADDMAELTLGLPGRRGRAVARVEQAIAPWVAALGDRAPRGRLGTGGTAPARSGRSQPGREAKRSRTRSRRAAALTPGTRALVFGRHARAADVAAVAEQALAADPASVVAFKDSIGEHRRRGALHALRGTPAVVMVGDHDRLCPPRHARAIAAELPDAELVLFPGAGHMLTYERDPEVTAHLRGLLDAARAGTTVTATGKADRVLA